MEVAKETPTISKLEKSVRSHVVLALDHQTDRVRQKSYYPTTHFNAASIFDFWGGGEYFGELFCLKLTFVEIE